MSKTKIINNNMFYLEVLKINIKNVYILKVFQIKQVIEMI
jgi:hypothetical protein